MSSSGIGLPSASQRYALRVVGIVIPSTCTMSETLAWLGPPPPRVQRAY